MKTHAIKTVLVVILLSAITGCQRDKKSPFENKIQFDSISVDRVYHMLEQPENPNCSLQIKFIYPVKFGNKEVLEAIRKQFVNSYFGDIYDELTPEKATDEYVNIYIEDYKSLEDDFKEEREKSKGAPIASWFSYYEMSSNDITYNKNNLLCYSVYYESYTGGAHGAHSQMNFVLDLEIGDLVTEEDIFIEDFQDELAQMLVDNIAIQNEVDNAKELESIGFFSVEEIYPNGNFLIDDTGITYFFNEYEIAAYVVGITNVQLPFQEIKHLLRKDSPIAKLI
ncbi:hypothetical protein M2459_001113 [Parabacteroides sp. PF5-5]|uniref:DUF3298 and DUF4163 domain-containing protein n=1 Tax=unclassified Parabacteroides TaxID=2649774 RepID=UPI002473CC60|nr:MULTISPECIES: DUF3298 and DUF4163 domain-containing protein [unclassified Parabacteroides]MDH6304380.1 hypothetical protein [Parabacteroides sp. PH5-39]MDH6315467.1 hypothetical protein [Parabacteroides sp. PF5-13]MDH6319039.1 hypothetical protein [Parabacteroides sp. PH5-13]MDH6322769.1 hypothetical protein [Parabacteroides sp. PH5-8]MDH6326659.1 hypothetical protein [Parabacteroides sp. PH5-41]